MAVNGYGSYGSLWSVRSFNWGVENPQFCVNGWPDSKGCSEVVGDDIVDKLPEDPFGMEIRSTFAAFSYGDEDFGEELRSELLRLGMQDAHGKDVIKELDLFYSRIMGFNPENNFSLVDVLKGVGTVNGSSIVDSVTSDNKAEGLLEAGPPLEAMVVVLGYLRARDLLAVERVCRPLRERIRDDPSLWRIIHVEPPFNEMITDDALVKLTSRAHGTLEGLSLVDCRKITDYGLKCVIQSNPKLTKLNVPGCIKLSLEGILGSLRALKSAAGAFGIKKLRIGSRIDVKSEHFDELKLLIGFDNTKQAARKPQFYRHDQLCLPWDDDRAIDLDMCPKCQNLRLVYDCPAESCVKAAQPCRACGLCIRRCIQCGCCIDNRDYEEMFCLGNRCMDCKRLEKVEIYRFCFYG